MKILYVGDVMGEAGVKTVESVLPGLIKDKQIDAVIAQAENVTEGKGLSLADYERLKRAGVNGFSGGNWSLHLDETHSLLEDEDTPVIRPANYPEGTAGKRYKLLPTPKGNILMVSLLGSIVGKDADRPVDNPLACIDQILNMLSKDKYIASVINIHGDFSSEKVVMGHYLDGRVSAVIGDHWHVPTADARVLKGGTAHITDVGMCGSLDSSLGVKLDSVIPRWRDGIQTRNVLETDGSMQFNSVLIDIDISTGRANNIEQIRIVD